MRWILLMVLGLAACSNSHITIKADDNITFSQCSRNQTEGELLAAAMSFNQKKDYDSALTCIEFMSLEFRKQPTVTLVWVATDMGKCGLDTKDFLSKISGPTTNSPMQNLMSAFTDISPLSTPYCLGAIEHLEAAYGSDPSKRSQDINGLIGVLGMAAVGTQLRESADTDQNGIVDPIFYSACIGDYNNLTDWEIRMIGAGLSAFTENAAAVANSSGGDTVQDLTVIAAMCGAPCHIKDYASNAWTEANINSIRDFVESSYVGIMTCNNADPSTCCP